MAARTQYDSPVIDASGDALDNIEVTVYEEDGSTEATIYANKTGGTTIANPITTDATGNVQFWADPASYVVAFHDTELPTRISDREISWEAISGSDEGIALAQLPTGIPVANLATVPACRVYNDANIALNDATTTSLTFNSERFDTDTMHSTSSNTSRITFTTAGVYIISGSVAFAANGTGRRLLIIRLNGTTDIAYQLSTTSLAASQTGISINTIYKFSATDFVELQAYQNSGGSLNVLATANVSPEFSAIRVSS